MGEEKGVYAGEQNEWPCCFHAHVFFCRFHVLSRSDAYLSRVGVGRIRVNPLVVDDVLESTGHETSTAAFVPVHHGAVNEVLGAQGHQLPRLQLHLGFEGSHGAERPARPTGALQKPQRCSDAAPWDQDMGRCKESFKPGSSHP